MNITGSITLTNARRDTSIGVGLVLTRYNDRGILQSATLNSLRWVQPEGLRAAIARALEEWEEVVGRHTPTLPDLE